MESLRSLRFAAQLLRRRPAFTVLTVGTLGLAIAANTTLFSLIEATLLRRPPYPDPDRLVAVREIGTRQREMNTSWPTGRDWLGSRLFTAAALYQQRVTSVLGAGGPRQAEVSVVGEGFFAALGVAPVVGRLPGRDEARKPVAVASERFWRQSLGGGELAGRRLEVEGHTFEVVGVMPARFDFPHRAELWLPIGVFPVPSPYRSAHNFRFVGRLRSDLGVAAAQEQLVALTRAVVRSGADASESDEYLPIGAVVRTLQQDRGQPVRSGLLLLAGAAGFVLLVACLNLASSFLARGLERERELAVRRALGATRQRLLGQLLAEALLLALLGAAFGVALSLLTGRLLLSLAPPLLAEVAPHLDLRLGGFALAAAAVSALLFGLLPALLATRAPATPLRGGRSEGVSPGQRRTWATLLAAQAGLALLLLAGAGLLLRSFAAVLAVAPGFDPAGVATLALAPPESRYAGNEAVADLHRRLLAAVEQRPGVAAAGLVSEPPLDGWDQGGQLKAESGRKGSASYRVASGGFFRTLDIPLVAGRLFDARDELAAPHVALVDRAAAELFWPGEDPLGKRISSEGMDEWGIDAPGGQPKQWATVVGVVGPVRQSDLAAAPRPCVYFAISQRPFPWPTLVARSRSTAGAVLPALESALSSVAPDVAAKSSTLAAAVAQSTAQRRFALLLLALFGALALLLAGIGVYGVVAYAVARRTRELGVRLALGAAPRQARGLVLRGALAPVAVGVAVALLVAAPLAGALRALLFEVKPWDPATWLAAAVVLGAAALLAGWLPARRAGALDPMRSLRAE